MEWEIVMGLEVHTELATKTKIFCGCSTEFGGEPNTHVCEICSGAPEHFRFNKRVVEFAVRTGIATNCTITQNNKFGLKNYFLLLICRKRIRYHSFICLSAATVL